MILSQAGVELELSLANSSYFSSIRAGWFGREDIGRQLRHRYQWLIIGKLEPPFASGGKGES